jgi:ABC-2 type transport system ATP-binding protein
LTSSLSPSSSASPLRSTSPSGSNLPSFNSSLPAIRVSDAAKHFGRGKNSSGEKVLKALDGVSLQVEQGEFFGLLGPNGAGKTTLISLISGLSRPTAGRVEVMGHDVVSDFRAARKSLGVVPQELVFDPFFNVRELLRFTSGYYGVKGNDAWIDEVLAELDLTSKANANMRTLSGGMKRRVLVAQALVHKPPVIVLDEPTAGVDVELRQALWKFIQKLNQRGHTIILTTHYLEEAQELCTRIAMLKAGKIVALENTSALLKTFSQRRLSLRLSGAPLPAQFQGRVVNTRADGAVILQLENYEEVEPLLGSLRGAGCKIEEMELAHADLEDVFVKIMNRGASA